MMFTKIILVTIILGISAAQKHAYTYYHPKHYEYDQKHSAPAQKQFVRTGTNRVIPVVEYEFIQGYSSFIKNKIPKQTTADKNQIITPHTPIQEHVTLKNDQIFNQQSESIANNNTIKPIDVNNSNQTFTDEVISFTTIKNYIPIQKGLRSPKYRFHYERKSGNNNNQTQTDNTSSLVDNNLIKNKNSIDIQKPTNNKNSTENKATTQETISAKNNRDTSVVLNDKTQVDKSGNHVFGQKLSSTISSHITSHQPHTLVQEPKEALNNKDVNKEIKGNSAFEKKIPLKFEIQYKKSTTGINQSTPATSHTLNEKHDKKVENKIQVSKVNPNQQHTLRNQEKENILTKKPADTVNKEPLNQHHYEEDNSQHYSKYEFKYGVVDHHTKDYKLHHETREGDVVRGKYSFYQPDGRLRTVNYSVDKHSGFNAQVTYSGHAAHPSHGDH